MNKRADNHSLVNYLDNSYDARFYLNMHNYRSMQRINKDLLQMVFGKYVTLLENVKRTSIRTQRRRSSAEHPCDN